MSGVPRTKLPWAHGLIDELIVNVAGDTRRITIARATAAINAYIGPSYQTRAHLDADLTWAAGAIAQVYGDSNPALIGSYRKSGASGSGSWSRIGGLPSSSIGDDKLAAEVAAREAGLRDLGVPYLTNIGGTANDITASAEYVGDKVIVVPAATNTGGVTLDINGEGSRHVRDADGVGLEAGALVAGRPYVLTWVVNVWRVTAGMLLPSDRAALMDRTEHTGTQPVETIDGLHDRLQGLAMASLIAAEGVPVADILPTLSAAAAVWINADDLPDGPVTSLTTGGAMPVTLDESGSGASPTKTRAGLQFQHPGKYLRYVDVSPRMVQRATLVLDITPTGTCGGTAIALSLSTDNSTRATVQVGNQVVGQLYRLYGPGGQILNAELPKPLGERIVIAFGIDLPAGRISVTDQDGYTTHMDLASPPAAIPVRDIRIGQGCDFLLHRAAIFLEDAE